MRKLNDAQMATVVTRYAEGESSDGIARSLGVSAVAVRGLLHRRGVVLRSQREAQTRHSLRHDAFDVLTPDALYWCGFLFADGTLTPARSGAAGLAVVVSDRDRGHLDKLRAFLGSTHAITAIARPDVNARGASRFAVRSTQLHDRLEALGMTGGPLPPELAASHHFWRGVVDGDGSLGCYNGIPHLRLVGTAWLLAAFQAFIAAERISRATVRPHKTIYVVALCGRSATRGAAALYTDAPTSLTRKLNAARNIAAGHAVTARGGLALAGPANREPPSALVA
jgi:hypothetical protein